MKTFITLFSFFVFAITSLQAQYSDASLNGPWMLLTYQGNPSNINPIYLLFDGAGVVSEIGSFGGNIPPVGSYAVQSNGSITGYLSTEGINFFGMMNSATTASIYPIFSPDTIGPFDLITISDPGALAGTWEGDFITIDQTTDTVTLQVSVNASGAITNIFPFSPPFSGRLFKEGQHTAGYLYTGETSGFSAFSIDTAVLSGMTLSGEFRFDCDSCGYGVFSMTKIISSGIGSKPSYVSDMIHFPNPFDNSFTLEYTLVRDLDVTLLIFDQSGRMIRTWFDGQQMSGRQSMTWNGEDNNGTPVLQGMYSYIMIVDGAIIAKDQVIKM